MVVKLRSKAGFSPDFKLESKYWNWNVGRESGKRKTTLLRHLRHSKHLVADAQFSRAPDESPAGGRMYRRDSEVGLLL